jgi:hypothetical protein
MLLIYISITYLPFDLQCTHDTTQDFSYRHNV